MVYTRGNQPFHGNVLSMFAPLKKSNITFEEEPHSLPRVNEFNPTNKLPAQVQL